MPKLIGRVRCRRKRMTNLTLRDLAYLATITKTLQELHIPGSEGLRFTEQLEKKLRKMYKERVIVQ